MSAPKIAAVGVTNPSIDDLLTKTDSKYQLVLYSAKRARQINAYYSQLGEGLLEYVGPLVDTHVQEKPLSIALREIADDLLTCEHVDPAELAAEEAAAQQAAADAGARRRRVTTDAGSTRPRPSETAVAAPPRVVLGVAGGIAAYKACELLRRLTESGHDVTVVPTASALRVRRRAHLGRAVGQAGPDRRVDDVHEVPHVRIGQSADLVVVAPATADLLAKAAHGLADDLLTNTLLTARCPVVLAPAMHTEMWEHPATQANVATLRSRGVLVVEPAEGRLTGADTGKGRLPEPAELFEVLPRGARPRRRAAQRPRRAPRRRLRRRHPRVPRPGPLPRQPLLGPAGLRAGPGRRRPRRRGHPGRRQRRRCPTPPASRSSRVETTAQLRDDVVGRRGHADAVVMAAAPADFRPTAVSDAKIKKADDGSAPSIELAQNPDILHELATHRARPGLGGRRLRRRDRRRHRLGARPRPRQAGAQGLRPARRQRRQRGSGLRQPRQRGRHPRAPTAAAVDVPARLEGRAGPRHLGRGRAAQDSHPEIARLASWSLPSLP